jgi:photosystem II stability/assembly factor-like uncharacterized protein
MSRRLRRLTFTGFAALAIAAAGAPAVATATSSVTSGGASADPVGGPVPPGFRVADLSFVGTRQGWALGTAPCSHKPCTSVLRTTNRGRTWVGIPAPIASLTSCTHACVSGLRFANPEVGYAFRSSLEMTTDGGQTWHQQPGNAIGLAVSGDTVIRAVADHPAGCPPGCRFRVKAAPVGGTTWHRLHAPRVTGDGADVEASGSTVVVTYSQNPAGGAPSAHVTMLLSRDGGTTWTKRKDPCGQRVAGEDDTASVATATHRQVAVLCQPRSGGHGHDFVLTSANGGRHFGTAHAITAAGGRRSAYAVSTTGRALLVATARFHASRVVYAVDVSRDGGEHWTRTLRTTGPARGNLRHFLGAESARVAHFVGNDHTVSRTSNAGRTWRTIRFAG